MALRLSEAEQGDDYTKDGSVDLKGRPVLRSKRGGWTACYYIVVYEAFERMAYYGVTSNLVLYLTRELHRGTVAAANDVTNWVGTGFLTSVLGAYIADSHLGRFWTFVISSAINFMGMCLLTITVSVPSLKPPACSHQSPNSLSCKPASKLQVGAFFAGLYLLALGAGGTKPNISTIGADQFDEFDPTERSHKLSFFNWWMFSIFLGTLFANIILVYVQDNVGWSVGYGLPTIGLAISLVVFFSGTKFYRHKLSQGSPLTRMAKVLVVALRKWRVTVPEDQAQLYELDLEEYTKKGKFMIYPTNSLRFLNKAAVRIGPSDPWMLCTVTQVEETKQMLRMIPILVSMFIPAAMIAQVNTLFVKQGTTLDRHLGPGHHFQIPPASLTSFVTASMLVSIILYDRILMRVMRSWTKNPRGITLLQRMGVGLTLHIIIMLIASLVERRQLNFLLRMKNNEIGVHKNLTIFTLVPQYVVMGVADAFLVVGKTEFFYDQAPESMKSLGASYSLVSFGVGNFLSSVILSTISGFTKRGGRKGWILNDLDASHLDYYYAVLSGLSVFNLVFFLFVSKFYVYKAELFESFNTSF